MSKLPRNVVSQTVSNGVTYTVCKPQRTPKAKMAVKQSRGFVSGSGGLSTGFPKLVKFKTL